jgi:uncharacterized protein YebE (UPF0316 family)
MGSGVLFDLTAVPAVFVPFLIFFARIIDVSLGTLRIVLVSQGRRMYASVLGFTEVFIWLITISQILKNLEGWTSYVAYSAGFAAGTYVGMTIERRLTERKAIVRVVAPGGVEALAKKLVQEGYRITRIAGQGAMGPVELVFSVVHRKKLNDFLGIVKIFNPDSFYSVEDVLQAQHFESTPQASPLSRRLLQPFFWFRKGK